MAAIWEIVSNYVEFLTRLKIGIPDIIEVIIISFLVYQIMLWIKNTKAWTLFKGIVVLLGFTLLAAIFQLSTIIWIAEKTLGIGVTAAIIVFQPELRKALEQLGQKSIISGILPFDNNKNVNERFSDFTIGEIVKASFELSRTKTGALMVIEQNVSLQEFEKTGIHMDAIISRQLLINIFEHNTPLHDGAIIIRGNRIISATCYLPLSDSTELSKDLGTRHRAGVGVSEVTDSLTIIVSEETGKVSIAFGGQLIRNIDVENLKNKLITLQNKVIDAKRFRLWKGRKKNEE